MRPYYEQDGVTIYHGDCRELLPALTADVVVTDPPYGETQLAWDARVPGWAVGLNAPQLWCFGSLRFFFASHGQLVEAGWAFAQEVIWEKQNGSGFSADRFRRVHEYALHYYKGAWSSLYVAPQTTPDAQARSVRRGARSAHWHGASGASNYVSQEGGPRLMRSVLRVRSCHHAAVHPTQKPTALLEPLIAYSCPAGGRVLDPFCGSGSTLVAARGSGRRAIGIEIDERYCEIAAKRLAQGVLAFD